MSERDDLLRHVIEHPDDDAPRLVMADWLDEHGEPERAEFIRLQVSLAQDDIALATLPMPEITTSDKLYLNRPIPGRRPRVERMSWLHDRHQAAWTADVAKWARHHVVFSRGFISHVTTTASQWLKGAAGLHRAAPVTHLHLNHADGHLAALAKQRQLARASSLTLNSAGITIADEGAAFAASPHLGRLRSLFISGPPAANPEGGLAHLLGAPWPELRALDVRGRELFDGNLARLVANPATGSLVRLRLLSRGVSSAGAELLADSPLLGNVESLSLWNTTIGDAGAIALVRSPHLKSLRHLHIGGADMSAAGVGNLAAEPGLARINWLDLSHNAIGGAGVRALAESPHVAGLRTLDLRGCGIADDAVWQMLVRSPHLAGVRRLLVANNPVGETAASALRERFGEELYLTGRAFPE